jgi:hypothetical protein
MAIVLKNLIPPKAPNLPIGPVDYEQRFQDQLNNVLRLYFNQIDNVMQSLLGSTDGGRFIRFPYGSFYQDGNTTLSVVIPNGTSTAAISVASTTGFPTSGWILIESEIIAYTGKTTTTFTGITRSVLGTSGAGHAVGVAITEVQGTGSSTTIGTVLFNNTDLSNSIYTSTDFSKIYFTYPGIYNFQFSAQLLNFTSSEDNVTLWIRQNGTDISASAGLVQVNSKHGSAPGAVIASWNYFISANAGDYVSMAWTSDTGNTVIASFPSSAVAPVHPLSPGIIATAQFVSALPA